jgi:hypothetical protein
VGRRIDAVDTEPPRFPLSRITTIRQAVGNLLCNEAINILVCSAACGADLIALDVAITSGVRCRIVLPYPPPLFRNTSVIDRPGDWGPLYDQLITAVDAAGDLVILSEAAGDPAAFFHVNEEIIREASSLAMPNRPFAVLVWDDVSHSDADATAHFHALAVDAGFIERTILTCCD